MDDLVTRLSNICLQHYRRAGRQPRPPTQEEVTRIRQLAALALAPLAPDSTLQPTPTVPPNSPSASFAELEGVAWRLSANMFVYENPDLLDRALNEIPLQHIHEKATELSASSSSSSASALPFEDALAQALVQWYKSSYMRWVDAFPCPRCSGPTTVVGMAMPTPEERTGGADRVEVHKCRLESCGAVRRFGRYNDPGVLMKTREGRCGEWANLFTLFLRAVGLRTRYVWNREDHVWNEYFSPHEQRWIHIDSCEAARDQPTLYEKGWGKKMSYIFAFSVEGARDVSRAYTLDWPAMSSRRNWVPEEEIHGVMRNVTSIRRAHLPAEQRAELEAEDSAEDGRLALGPKREDEAEQPRQSGSADWTEARGEAGPEQAS